MIQRYTSAADCPRHRGIALITVIAILAVSMIVIGGLLGQLVREHRQCRLRHEERQCRRLAESGIERAATMRASDPSYTGETWTIAAADLGQSDDASVEIQIENGHAIATAMYPAGNEPRLRHTTTGELN